MPAFYNEHDAFPARWLENLVNAGHLPAGYVDSRDIREVKPEDLVEYSQCHFFAGIGGWPLALRMAGWPDDRPVWTGSPPCFAGDTMVRTDSGYMRIDRVRVGDRVLTHKGRYQKVLRVGCKLTKNLVEIRGHGAPGIICTPDHKFLDSCGKWCEASDMPGRRWVIPQPGEGSTIPQIIPQTWSGRPANIPTDVESREFARYCGFWVGNGYASDKAVYICDDLDSGKDLKQMAVAAGLSGCIVRKRTSAVFESGSVLLAKWMTENFGKGAAQKKIPLWVFSMQQTWITAFLDGLVAADGSISRNAKGNGRHYSLTTVSHELVLGVRDILLLLGKSPSLRKTKRSATHVIEGRIVNQRDTYTVRWQINPNRQSMLHDKKASYGLVKKTILVEGIMQVYDLSVDKDESYTVEGVAVHNCQPFSVSGKQRGKRDDRHLAPVWLELVRSAKPPVIFGEQVANAIRHGWLDDLFDNLEGEGYTCAAAVLPACSVGAPHKRDRLFFCAMGNAISTRLEGHAGHDDETGKWPHPYRSTVETGFPDWCDFDLANGKDGKIRPIEPGTFPVVDGFSGLVGQIRAYGNAIVPQLAAEFVRSIFR